MSIRWKIFYSNGSAFSDADGSPFDAPSRGVQVIACEDKDVGRTLQRQRDYYWWMGEEVGWWGGDLFGLYDYLLSLGPKKVIFGRSIRDADYQTILKRAHDDHYLPPKTAIAVREASCS